MASPHEPDILDHFVHKIIDLQPGSYNVFGSGQPGMGGSSASMEGGLNDGMDITWRLKQQTFTFGMAIREHKPKEEIGALADQVEGSLRGEELVDLLNADEVKGLIETLHNIVQAA